LKSHNWSVPSCINNGIEKKNTTEGKKKNIVL
jgi:hypothetical protein